MKLKVAFNIDPTGYENDITEEIYIPKDVCMYCLHDKHNRFYDEIKKALLNKGYDFGCESGYYFELLKVYVV